MGSPVVSVIVPIHNAEAFLRQCLDSLIQQTLTDLEIICVDDGSTDDSRAILNEYAAQDRRVRVIEGPGLGSAGAARNAGLEVAEGKYLSFLDADDFFAPSMLAQLLQKAKQDDAQVVLTKFRSYDERTGDSVAVEWPLRLQYLPTAGPFSPAEVGDPLFIAVNPAAWNKLFRADLIHQTGLRFQQLRRTNDAFFTYMAIAHAEQITFLNEHPISYRIGNAGSLQESRQETPLDFVEALAAMQAQLTKTGRYATFERAFVNLALDLCLSSLRRAATATSYTELHRALTTEVLARFTITGRPADYFLRPADAAQLADLVSMPAQDYLFSRLLVLTETAEKARSEARQAERQLDLRATLVATPEAQARQVRLASAPPEGEPVDVSVIVTVHNAETHLVECLASVQAQTGVNLQIVCIDHGSTDNSVEILKRLAATDARIEVVGQADAGRSVARNTGFESSRGRYVCYLDGRDRWQGDELAKLVSKADADALDVVMFDAICLAEPTTDAATWKRLEGHYQRGEADGEVRTGLQQLTKMVAAGDYRSEAWLHLIRKDLISRAGLGFYPGSSGAEDLFTFSLLLAARRVASSKLAFYRRRVRPSVALTAADRTAAARGYFISNLEMQRLVIGGPFQPDEAAAIGSLLFAAYQGCRSNFVRLNSDLADRFGEIDPSPEAQALFLLLKRARKEAQFKRVPVKRPTDQSRLANLRRLLGRAKRRLLKPA